MKPIRGEVVKGFWSGGYGRCPNICDRAGIHVTLPASNSAWTGFDSIQQAREFMEEQGIEGQVVDLRGIRERFPTGSRLRLTGLPYGDVEGEVAASADGSTVSGISLDITVGPDNEPAVLSLIGRELAFSWERGGHLRSVQAEIIAPAVPEPTPSLGGC